MDDKKFMAPITNTAVEIEASGGAAKRGQRLTPSSQQ